MDKPLVEQVMDAIFSGQGESPTHKGIFRDVYGADYPEEAEPLSYVSLSELRRVAREVRIDAGQTLADLGCGRGGPGLWVARERGAQLVGIDLSEQGVAQARARASAFGPPDRARFEVGDLTALRFDSGSFDAGMSIAVIWSIPGPEKVLSEIARVLRPGAHFVFTDWDPTASTTSHTAPTRSSSRADCRTVE